MNIYAMIPARLDSKRLTRKNIHPFLGKPMIYYAITACKSIKMIDRVFVSTESEEIAQIAKEFGADILIRPKNLAEDDVPTQDVMKHFALTFKEMDIIVLVQANSPNVRAENIEKAINKIIKHNLWEVRSVDKEGSENGAIWVATREAIFWDGLSVHFGVVIDEAVDIHTLEDLKRAEDFEKTESN